MSWLNLNDSLNNLKGQISNFANTVLADENEQEGRGSSNTDLEELQRICQQQLEEINYLRNQKAGNGQAGKTFTKDEFGQPNQSWSWDVSDPSNNEHDNTIANLKKTIAELQNEKKELTSNLLLLDSEHQLNNEKLINMKNKLQKEFSELEENYNKLKQENVSLVGDNKKNQAELSEFKIKYQETLEKTVPEADINENCTKCEAILQENQKFRSEIDKLADEIIVLKANNAAMQKTLDDSSTNEEFARMSEKIKLYESENKILISELKKATQTVAEHEKKSVQDTEEFKKLASVLEDYEQQVESLKQQLSVKNSSDLDKMKSNFEEVEEKLRQAVQEKEQTHTKYINILSENMKRYIDCDKLSEVNPENGDDPQVVEFNHQVENILNILWDLKSKCGSLEKELCNVTQEKTNILSEKNHEIEKLIQNSEILSQEVITKSQTIKDYENECNELIKNNDLLIGELKMLKNNVGLQTISESNEDNIILLESQLENANKKIEELESMCHSENASGELSLDEINEKFVSKTLYDKLLVELEESRKENCSILEEIDKCEESFSVVAEEKENVASCLEKVKTDLENTEYQYTELNINMEVLKEEVENYKKKVEELLEQKLSVEKLNMEYERSNEDIRSELNMVKERLLLEEDSRKHCENQIRNLTEKLQNAKMAETSLKLQYDTISKELSAAAEAKFTLESNFNNAVLALNQCKDELKELREENERLNKVIAEAKVDPPLVQFENVSLLGNSDTAILQEKTDLQRRFEELQQSHDSLCEEKSNLTAEIERLTALANHTKCHENIAVLEKNVEELLAAKNELTNVIITKHQESVTYHNEIQRLTQILNTEAEKNRNLTTEFEALKITAAASDVQKKDEEIDKLTDQNNFLRQKCEVLAQNLLEEQARTQKIISEQSSQSEKEQMLARKLERLQTHLIEVEEHYTQELLRTEERNTELQAKVNEIEQREKNSSTMYTSVSIRANQHVETLQHQLQLITNQRDELRRRISDAEDHASKQEAALANLQFVLEQFQKEKENDVLKETERVRRQITVEKKVQEDLKKEIIGLQTQLEESKHGLLAASRLSDQLEHSKQLVTTLRTEVSQLKEKLHKNEEQLHNISSQSDGKVDKSLVKNLVIGFVASNNNLNKDQLQILKIIATVLDFNQQDHDKVNLSKAQQGWLSAFLSPQTSQGMSQESLSQAFVKFLENESKPRLVPSLLNNDSETPNSRKNSTSVPRQSPGILSEMVLPTFADFAQNRNSSSILKDVLKDNS